MSNEPASNGTMEAVRQEIGERADSVWTHGKGKAPAIAKHRKQALKSSSGRVAIIDGCRTPFCRREADKKIGCKTRVPAGGLSFI